MNVERLTRIRDELLSERLPVGFSMNFFMVSNMKGFNSPDNDFNYCSTICCIAGMACSHEFNEKSPIRLGKLIDHEFSTVAGEYLGLDEIRRELLFFPIRYFPDSQTSHFYEWITPRQAAETINGLIETGEVDWSHIVEPLSGPEHYVKSLGVDPKTASEYAERFRRDVLQIE